MVKKSTVIFTILALLAFGACTCWGYTVSQWPVPGIPNTVYGPGTVFGPGPYAWPLSNKSISDPHVQLRNPGEF